MPIHKHAKVEITIIDSRAAFGELNELLDAMVEAKL